MNKELDNRKQILSWSLYDWGNSAFATTVMAGFFPLFFNEYWSHGADTTMTTFRLGFANSIASIIIVILAPILGSIADQSSAKKRFLASFAFMGALMACGLGLVGQGNWQMAMLLFVGGTIGFSGSNIFYDSLLTGVASDKNMDKVSAFGFSLGYLGGGVLFAINVLMYLKFELFGFADAAQAIKVSFITVGIWWAAFTFPLLFFVKEPQNPDAKLAEGNVLKASFAQLSQTFKEIRKLKHIFLFLAAYWLYIDGVDTIVRMAVDYGMSIGFEPSDLITALLMVQFIGFPAAIGFGFLGNKIGTKKAIFIGIIAYLFITVGAAFMQHKSEFYMMAGAIGLVQGGIQALSRSYYAKMIPKHKSAEFFGFYNMLGKFAAVIGPLLMGAVGLLLSKAGLTEDLASRFSITSIAILFIAGAAIFYFVDDDEARKEVAALYGDKG